MKEILKIGLINMNVRYNRPDANKEELLRLNRQAAEAGAKIIVNTELGISGYSFQSREEAACVVQSADGPVMRALSEIAAGHGAYIVLGYAERDTATGVYYNAAAAFSPDGEIVCHYRKNSAETRWACPGNPLRDNTFETPWGRVGLLICSDTYFSAIPRMTALRGADIILVPANWPEEPFDPGLLWQTRAYENGVYVVACNRCGDDRTMKFDKAPSCVYAPSGEQLLRERSDDSRIFYVSLPLENDRLASRRRDRLQSRTPDRYVSMYMDMRYAADLTSWYGLPKPDDYQVSAFMMPPEQVFSDNAVEDKIRGAFPDGKPRLLVLPAGTARYPNFIDEAERRIFKIAVLHNIDICAGFQEKPGDGKCELIFSDASGKVSRYPAAERRSKLRIVDTSRARVLLAEVEELMHPETALAAAKLGCDLAVSSSGTALSGMRRQTIAARCVDQIYIAAAGNDYAFICEPPESHYSWKEVNADGGGVCSLPIDFTKSRNKRFYDRLDFDILLDRGTKI